MEPEDPKDWHKKRIKMEQDYILNNRDNIDNFLDDIWSNCDLEPPNLSEEFSNAIFGVNDQQINPQSVIKEENFTEENNSCTWHENFVTKEEVVNDGSNLNIQGKNNQSARKRNEGSSSRSVERAEIRRQRMLKNRASAARSRARTLVPEKLQ
ncbi:uncharacterized protein A4U43_C08F1730 [Asparagus officinalis]|nr:uncharacterized protein A4U43_C08F1730 [Asparagus officinalis]